MSETWTSADTVAFSRALGRALSGSMELHPHLQLYDMSGQMQALIGKHVIGLLNHRDRLREQGLPGGEIEDKYLYLSALDDFGVDCPHVWDVTVVEPAGPVNPKYDRFVLFRNGPYAKYGNHCIMCGIVQVLVREEQ